MTSHPRSIDETLLDGPPPTSAKDFSHPKLRRFSQALKLRKYLGHGEDGLVYEAVTETGKRVAVKMFWRTQQPVRHLPTGATRPTEWPFQDECAIAALLEKMKYAMQRTTENPNESIRFIKEPRTRRDALHNFMAFSDEYRTARSPDESESYAPPPDFPCVPVCYGWTKVPRAGLPIYRRVDEDDWFWALVYDLIKDPQQDLAIGQNVLDFFFQAGFSLQPYKEDNWRGVIPLDMNDLCPPTSRFWHKSYWQCHDAATWFEPAAVTDTHIDIHTFLISILSK